MNIYLLRHGPAGEASNEYPDDSQRPLTEDGKEKVQEIAKGMKHLGLTFDVVYTSPYKRTRQTAEIVCKVLKLKAPVQLKNLEPGVHAASLVGKIEAGDKGENLLLVGHEPDLSRLITLFATGLNGGVVHMRKGALALVSAGELKAGRCGTIEWLFDPDHLAGLSQK